MMSTKRSKTSRLAGAERTLPVRSSDQLCSPTPERPTATSLQDPTPQSLVRQTELVLERLRPAFVDADEIDALLGVLRSDFFENIVSTYEVRFLWESTLRFKM